MKAAKTLAKLVAAAKLQKAGKLMAAAEQLQEAADEDLELVHELVSTIEELEEPAVAKARQIAKARSRHVAKLARGVATKAGAELEGEEELAGEEDEDGEPLEASARDLARTMASEVEAEGDETAEDLDGEEADADLEQDFDVTSAKVAATRRAMAKVARAKAGK